VWLDAIGVDAMKISKNEELEHFFLFKIDLQKTLSFLNIGSCQIPPFD